MKLIVGLGNPGKEYANTRHNVGFLFVEYLRDKWGFEDWKDSKFKGIISEGAIKGEKVILLKPMTYMNLSGESVISLVNFYKIPRENILVLSDDIDMDFGKIRLREKGSSGGQNGLKSIAALLGTEEFARLKIGIGRDDRYDVADWVLSKFSSEEKKNLQEAVFEEACESVEKWTGNLIPMNECR
ncbi:MAG: aminoacyl-tRNA hydrolase [Candidatus Gracilibacteria bacterium]|nr:aminoacyl-tRNA hydrolase [Candidatus Gracilibacteria bacterium]